MPRRVYPTPFIIHPPDDLVQKQPALRHLSSKLAQEYADRKVVREEDLQAMGSMLWSALGPAVQAAFDAAHAGAGAAILSILIESGASDVQALPWETLYHPTHRFVGKHPAFTLTRRIEAAPEASLPLDRGPLRVLLFTSLPDDVDPEKGRLDVEEEQAQVQEALLPWLAQGRVQLEMPDDGRFVTLQGLMKNFQPHVLFLSGHGSFHHEPHTGEAPYGVFSFEDDAGRSDAIKEDQIAQVLVGTGVQAVVISACESGKAASEALNNGLTRRISAQGIPHVIGMRESVTDRAGIRFARAFCDDLAQRERVDTALQAARIAIQSPLDDDIRRREAAFVAAEELSSGQWCLPMLLSANPHTPLIDWEFSPRAIEARRYGEHLSTVSLPPRFVGRRAEMRDYKSGLLRGAIQSLLITGPGGQGKTSLAGKLALDLQKQGWGVFAWSARPENPWRDFEFEMELALDEANAKRYNSYRGRFEGDAARAKFMLGLLTEQYGGRVVLFLDNLESLQDPVTLALPDAPAAAWLQTAQAMDGLILLATSRWALPGWTGEHLLLERASYGDFLRMAQELALRKQLPRSLLAKRDLLRRAYEALGGNPRGLEFFAAAARGMKDAEEEGAFLEALAQTKGDLQANMAIAEIHERLPEDARRLLARLPAYREAVPAEGLLKLGLDLPEPAALLERLLAVSLLEAQYEPEWQVIQYQCVPMVTDWLKARNLVDDDPCWLDAAADYSLYLWKQERRTLIQAIATHRALRRAGRDAEARRLALDYVVGPLTRAGFYATLLRDWLPRICESEDPDTRGAALGQTGKLLFHVGDYDTALRYLQQSLAIRQQIGDKAGEGTTLNNISQIYDAQGDYDTALRYLQQSLAICQQIGDKAGLCATLFNMGHIHLQNEQLQEAVSAWVTVYLIAAPMNLAQVLRALAALAPQLGLPEGLAGWEMLAQRMQGGAGEASHKHSK